MVEASQGIHQPTLDLLIGRWLTAFGRKYRGQPQIDSSFFSIDSTYAPSSAALWLHTPPEDLLPSDV